MILICFLGSIQNDLTPTPSDIGILEEDTSMCLTGAPR